MSQLVETGQGVAEFPDEMSHDEIAGVIKKQFYSADNPPPKEVQPTSFSAIGLGSSEFAMPGQMAEGFDPIEAAKAQTSSESLAPIPQIPQQEGILKQTGAALVNTATGAVNFATSPAGLNTLPTAIANPVLSRILAGAYAPEMVTEGVKGAVNEPTWQGKLQNSLGALLGLGGAVHAMGLTAKLAPLSKEVPLVQEVPQAPVEAVKPEELTAKPETLTPQEEVVSQGQAARQEWEKRNETQRTEQYYNDAAQKLYDDTFQKASGPVASKEFEAETAIAKEKALAQTLGRDEFTLQVYDRAHQIASQAVEAKHGLSASETRPFKYVDSEAASREVLSNLPKAEPVGVTETLSELKRRNGVTPGEVARPVPEARQAPVESGLQAKPELPENVEVTIKASTSKGEELEVKMDAREAEKVLNERKTALENLIDCLGA